ncbi:hypothetical protein HMPREF1218_1337 [Hoylesella pleuritidis F0068]|uniref:Uncharacterized protein n=2 Tax=Hoylesella pleuritidis TaxID=407975 RepID=U2KNW5_9BACT|nr:hypothetical protein HMPREF1218_1337 [Hoylesella pleuritidis F0068]
MNMNKNQVMKQAYSTPEISVVKMPTEYSLLAGSQLDGGHNPGRIGDNHGDAKRNSFEEEEEEEFTQGNNPWGD